MPQVKATIDEEDLKALEEIHKATGYSVSALVRGAINTFLEYSHVEPWHGA